MTSQPAAPNMRVQRTRSSPSAPHSPLTRRPLGGRWLVLLVALGPCTTAAFASTPTPVPTRTARQHTDPILIKRVEPHLPAGVVAGTPIMRARITEKGDVVDVQVIRSVGKDLDKYYVEAIRQWKYKPATFNGEPVAADLTITVSIAYR